MGGAQPDAPGEIAQLLDVIEEHESAVRYDLRKLGMSLDDIGEAYSWADAVAVVEQLKRDTGSHLWASLAGYSWAASMADVALILMATRKLNEGRAAGDPPIELPLPFQPERAEALPVATPEETSDALAYLREHTAIQ